MFSRYWRINFKKWIPDEYYGKNICFDFSISNCFVNYKTWEIKGQSINVQKFKVDKLIPINFL